jgi:hypothetical protein
MLAPSRIGVMLIVEAQVSIRLGKDLENAPGLLM